jgi:hypothetical protein
MSNPNCPLCSRPEAPPFYDDGTRPYHRCGLCRLIFVPRKYHLPPDEEKKRYDLHENDPDDPGYRSFLNQLAEPLAERLQPGAHGLDYGCGPGPALPRMMAGMGFPMERYDPFYADDPGLLGRTYDFVTCTEVVEHFRRPGEDWKTLKKLLRRDGMLAVMTQLTDCCEDFSRWHYRRDDTHICFYSRGTLKWIAGRLCLRPAFVGKSVVLFEKLYTCATLPMSSAKLIR